MRRTGLVRRVGAAVLAGGLAPMAAAGQPEIRPVGPGVVDPSTFKRVDPVVGDTDPLRMSLRELSVDLRQSDDFSNVYQLPGGQFARRSGGITAVFPRSTYVPTEGGVMAEIPAGTVFYLDGVPALRPWEMIGQGVGREGVESLARPGAVEGATRRLETGVNTSVRWAELMAAAAVESSASAAVVVDEGLFVGVRTLLRRAAEGV